MLNPQKLSTLDDMPKDVADRSNITPATLKLVGLQSPQSCVHCLLKHGSRRWPQASKTTAANSVPKSSASPAKHHLLRLSGLLTSSASYRGLLGCSSQSTCRAPARPTCAPEPPALRKEPEDASPLPIPGPYPEGWERLICRSQAHTTKPHCAPAPTHPMAMVMLRADVCGAQSWPLHQTPPFKVMSAKLNYKSLWSPVHKLIPKQIPRIPGQFLQAPPKTAIIFHSFQEVTQYR